MYFQTKMPAVSRAFGGARALRLKLSRKLEKILKIFPFQTKNALTGITIHVSRFGASWLVGF
jgi:hypothetical protein